MYEKDNLKNMIFSQWIELESQYWLKRQNASVLQLYGLRPTLQKQAWWSNQIYLFRGSVFPSVDYSCYFSSTLRCIQKKNSLGENI